MQAQRREDFTEVKKNKTQECDSYGRRNAKMSHLAEPAVWFVMPSSVGVRHDLQQEEKRNKCQRNGETRAKAAPSPEICRGCCAACDQKTAFLESPGANQPVGLRFNCCLQRGMAQEQIGTRVPGI